MVYVTWVPNDAVCDSMAFRGLVLGVIILDELPFIECPSMMSF